MKIKKKIRRPDNWCKHCKYLKDGEIGICSQTECIKDVQGIDKVTKFMKMLDRIIKRYDET